MKGSEMARVTGTERHVAIVGAGIVGVSAAIWLQRAGHRVTMIDPNPPGSQTSSGNGGVLASCSIVPVTVPSLLKSAPAMLANPQSPLFMRWSYLPRLMPWLARYLSHCRPGEVNRIADALHHIIGDSLAQHKALSGGTKAEKWLAPSDYLFVYSDRAHFQSDSFGWQVRAQRGIEWQELEGPAFTAYDPAFGPGFDFAVRLGDHGHIKDPGRYVGDLADHVIANGGTLVAAAAKDFRFAEQRVTGVLTKSGPVDCDSAVLTAGVWSRALMKQLGLDVPLESERGYHVDLVAPNIMPRSPVMVASGKFVATPMDGRLRCAGIVEFGGLDAPPSAKPFALLKKRIREAIPDLRWKEEIEWMGHRPAPSDSIPLIGEIAGRAGLYTGFGHHHIGLTGGPKTGRLLADLIGGQKPNIDLSAYSPNRF